MPTVMSWPEWARYDAVSLATLVRQGQVTPAELAGQVADGIAMLDPMLNAVIEVFGDVVDDPQKDGMRPEGPFSGVPCLMQDLGPMIKGRRQEFGARLMAGHVAARDSFLTTRIRAAGLNILGRTTTSEFGVCASAENPRVSVTRNPWSREHTSGGSSAGSGAMVAAGVIPISHAGGESGSIRIPAGINGTIGLKPSRGVFSCAPEDSDLMSVASIQGCHTRTVRDTALFVDACRGSAPGEFMPYWSAAEPYAQLIQRDPGRLRIALSHEWGDYRASAHIVEELSFAGRLFEALGHRVDWASPAIDFRAAYDAQTTCCLTNIAQTIDRLSRLGGHARPPADLIEPMNLRIWEAGIGVPYSARAQMQAVFNTTARGFGAFFEDWDILLTPISTATTPRLGTMDYLTLNDSDSPLQWFGKLWALYAYTPLGNLAGTPGLSLPMGVHDNGLPLGIQALSRPGNDGQLLQFGAQVERALNGRWNGGRLPPTHVTRAPLV